MGRRGYSSEADLIEALLRECQLEYDLTWTRPDERPMARSGARAEGDARPPTKLRPLIVGRSGLPSYSTDAKDGEDANTTDAKDGRKKASTTDAKAGRKKASRKKASTTDAKDGREDANRLLGIERESYERDLRAWRAHADLKQAAVAVVELAGTRRPVEGTVGRALKLFVRKHRRALRDLTQDVLGCAAPADKFNPLRHLTDGLHRRVPNSFWVPPRRRSDTQQKRAPSREVRSPTTATETRTAHGHDLSPREIAVMFVLEDQGASLTFKRGMTVAQALDQYRRRVAEALRRTPIRADEKTPPPADEKPPS